MPIDLNIVPCYMNVEMGILIKIKNKLENRSMLFLRNETVENQY